MTGGIFLLDPAGELTEMAETAFAAELDLQHLLARHPDLLAGDQIDPGTPRRASPRQGQGPGLLDLVGQRSQGRLMLPMVQKRRKLLDHLRLDQQPHEMQFQQMRPVFPSIPTKKVASTSSTSLWDIDPAGAIEWMPSLKLRWLRRRESGAILNVLGLARRRS